MPASDLDTLAYWSDAKDLSKYDRVRAGPSDQGLVIMWSIYSPLLFLFSFVVMIVFLSIVTNRKVRRNPFNKYVLFLCVPDFLHSFLCAITCLASALNGGYSSWEMCQFQSFYLFFGTSANSWLNAAIACEVHKLLRSSHVRRKYYPPTDRQVYITSMTCIAIALVASSLPLIGKKVEWIPEPGIQAGFLCLASTENLTHTLVWWLVLVPMIFGLPYSYIAYVFYDVVFRTKLLPPRGKRRELSVFFFRIGAMFVFLWTPSIVALFFLKGLISPWWSWGLGLFSHTQDMVSALITMMKKDIGDAVNDFVFGCCRSGISGEDGDKSKPSRDTVHSSSVELGQSTYEDLLDERGLPIQGSDFQFLDEASALLGSKERPDQANDVPNNSGDDEWTENPSSANPKALEREV